MPTESTRPLARRIFRVVLGSAEIADGDLLRRFVATRDEEAFAEIVRRHGPMVYGVCRRVTRHPHDAEDAFQAAFVVLARRAGHVKQPELLGNWLYGVAYRTALEARAARRRVQEQPVSSAPEPTAPDSGGLTSPGSPEFADLRRVIDEELARLPEKYRAAVVLCDLEGASRADAAARLSIPEGTLSSRLAHARKVLAERLTRRGVTASAGAVTTALGREALAAVPRELATLATRVAVRSSAHPAPHPELVSPSVSSLADGVMKAMLVNRLRLALGTLATLALLGLGAYGLAQVPATNTTNPVVQELPPAPPNDFDPFGGDVIAQTQPKQPMKVAPKGIEDDDVPYAAFPSQGVVRIEEGKLIVRQRTSGYETVTNGDSPTTVVRQRVTAVRAYQADPADIAVFDMKGNRLLPKAWKEKFKVDVHVLVGYDGKLPNPRELALFREDTLVVVLPGQAAVPGVAGKYTLRVAPQGGYYYEPVPSIPTLPLTVPGDVAPPTLTPAPARPALPGRTPSPGTTPSPARPATGPVLHPPVPDENPIRS
jgi:RNA polymerase sigma factor (sigma-70 family)